MPINWVKKSIAAGLVGGGLLLAVLIAVGGKENGNKITIKQPENSKPAAVGSLNLPPSPIVEESLTQELSEKIGGDLLTRNPEELANLNPQELVNQYIADGVSNFDYNGLKPVIADNQIKIINNSSSELIKEYLQKFDKITQNYFGSVAGKITPEIKPENLSLLGEAYGKSIADLYQLAVPKNLSDIHKQTISILSAQYTAFKAVQNYQDDPLKALLSFQAITKLNEELATVQQSIFKFLTGKS